MKRRNILHLAGWRATVLRCGGGGAGDTQPPAPPVERNNILTIALDDLNDWVGFLGGHPQVKTPNLDTLAARSTVFERACCNAPTCTGSRAGALTGLSVQSAGVCGVWTRLLAA